jgi:uncharacterized membrane protein (DUF485 family)
VCYSDSCDARVRASDAYARSDAREIIKSPDFRRLVRRRWTVSAALLGVLFMTYYGFILLAGGREGLMSRRVGEFTTLAIPAGIGVIAIAFALTAAYVGWANRFYDPEVDRLKRQMK